MARRATLSSFDRAQRLEALREVSLELTSERDPGRLLTLIMARAGEILEAERSTCYLLQEVPKGEGTRDRLLVSRVAHGSEEIRLLIDDTSIAGYVATHGEIVNLEDAYQDSRFNPSIDHHQGFRTRSMLTAPMRNLRGQVIGVTQTMNKRGGASFDEEDEAMLLAFSSQAAIAVENARYLDLQRRTFETLVHGQAVAIDARDHITAGHTWRVAAYAVAVGSALGWEGEELELLRYAGLLHDQGKLGVPDEVLLKPSRLSNWEFEIIRTHAVKTKEILEHIRPLFPKRLRRVPEIAASHHEKLDGTGYPDGLKGESISVGARIVAVADIFDALTAHRPYRSPNSDEMVVEFLKGEAEVGKLDSRVVEALEKTLGKIMELREQINGKIGQRRRAAALEELLRKI